MNVTYQLSANHKSIREFACMCAFMSVCIYLYCFIAEPIIQFGLICFPYTTKDRNMVVSESDFLSSLTIKLFTLNNSISSLKRAE